MRLRINAAPVGDYTANPRCAHIPTQTSVSEQLRLNPDFRLRQLHKHLLQVWFGHLYVTFREPAAQLT